jgi:DNA-binding Lrp family transcriptional regulator
MKNIVVKYMLKNKEQSSIGDLDDLDVNIIRMLQDDSRQSCRTIAKELSTSPGTVSERIKRLVNNEVIRKFTAIIDPVKVGKLYTMFLMVRLKSQYRPEDVVKDIMEIDGSCCIHNITGNYHLHLLLRAADNHDAANLLDKIRAITGIERIDSFVVLRSFKAFYEVTI